jgi:membrane associated rhomboid family serine protease
MSRSLFERAADHERLSRDESVLFKTRNLPIVTTVLGVAMLAIFTIASASASRFDDWIARGATIAGRPVAEQLGRLVTAGFLHGSWKHVLLNLAALIMGGIFLERAVGHVRTAVVCAITLVGASCASVLLNHAGTSSIGASGMICGLYGALAALTLGVAPSLDAFRHSAMGRLVGTFVVYNVVYGLDQPHLDWWSHAGGFVVGAACGLALTPAVRARVLAGTAASIEAPARLGSEP